MSGVSMFYSFLALLSGANIAVSILMNARLGAIKGLYKSAYINYVMGLVIAVPLAIILKGFDFSNISLSLADAVAFTGGAIGFMVVVLNNHLTPKIGIIYVTILLFIGQLGVGTVIDAIRSGVFSFGKILGGVLIIAGLVYLVKIEKAPGKSNKS